MQIKTLLNFLLTGLMSFSLRAQCSPSNDSSFQIEGKAAMTVKEVRLARYEKDEKVHIDSAELKNGRFTFAGIINAPEVYYLEFDENFKLPIFMDNSLIEINIDGFSGDSISIEGAGIHKDWMKVHQDIQKFDNQLDEIRDAYYKAKSDGDEQLKSQFSRDYDSIEYRKDSFIDAFITGNSLSYITPYLTAKYKMYSGDPMRLENYKNSFGQSVMNSPYIEVINERIQKLKLTKIGNEIPSFTMLDTSGVMVSIEDFRGKFVLIDFWASWCGPCRRENPNIVSAFNEYNSKGFTVVGISLDEDRKAWVNAIVKDSLSWTNLSDLGGWENELAQKFGVRSIPFSILIDPNGTILVKDLHGEFLHHELKKYLRE